MLQALLEEAGILYSAQITNKQLTTGTMPSVQIKRCNISVTGVETH